MWGRTLSSLQLKPSNSKFLGLTLLAKSPTEMSDSPQEARLHKCPQASLLGISFTGPCFVLCPPHQVIGGPLCSLHFGIAVPGLGREERPPIRLLCRTELPGPCHRTACPSNQHRVFHENRSSLPQSYSSPGTHTRTSSSFLFQHSAS